MFKFQIAKGSCPLRSPSLPAKSAGTVSSMALLGFIGVLIAITVFLRMGNNTIRIGDANVNIEIVRTDEDKATGLSKYDSLDENKGMLFVYDPAEVPAFWMKGMKFPIDIIWIRGGNVVDITADVPVAEGNSLPLYQPKTEVDRVLEVNAGWVGRHNIKIGDVAQ